MDKNIVCDETVEDSFDERSSISIERDNSESIKVGDEKVGKITGYKFRILVRDKPDLTGTLTREEVEMVYRLYSSEGANLNQRSVSLSFPQYTFQEFKKIIRAFNITKASAPLAPHVIEERSIEDLVTLTFQNKENNYLKKVEQDRSKNTEALLKEMSKKYYELKCSYEKMGETLIPKNKITPYTKSNYVESKQDLILHLADLHIGAKVRKTSIYQNEYNYDIVKSRLQALLVKISTKRYDTIIVNLLGDMLDGMDAQTARRDHIMPQNMDNFEQVTAFLEIMEWFMVSIQQMGICNNIKIYSVKDGNHDGITAYTAQLALLNKLNLILPNCETKLFTDFFGYYEFKAQKFILCHGKDSEFMKRGLPLNISDKEKIMIYNWLESQGITGTNIHFIKGDLHSDNLNSCYKMDYRNCLSLFGASDYANFNFERNNYGVSYSVIEDGEMMNGSFINL